MPKIRRLALQALSAYYITTGLWPLLSRSTFEAVTGRKTDYWLVEMVGLLATTNGIAIGAALRRKKIRDETIVLAALSCASFAAIDVLHVARKRIPRVYLGDAAIELFLAAALFCPD